MKQNRTLKLATDTTKNTGNIGEELAAAALERAGFTVSNLNTAIRRNFTFADLLAERNGVWYAISVRSRHKHTDDGAVKTRYKLNIAKMSKALAEIQQAIGVEAIPAFVAVEFDGGTYSAYFGLVSKQPRKNGIGMREHERAAYECLAENVPHHCPIPPNQYVPIERDLQVSVSVKSSRTVAERSRRLESAGRTVRSNRPVNNGQVEDRCGMTTRIMLQTFTSVMQTLFPDVEVECHKRYVSYVVGGRVFFFVRTSPSTLRALCRVQPGTFDQTTLAKTLRVAALDCGEARSEKMSLGSYLWVKRERTFRDAVLVGMKEDFNLHSTAFFQFLTEVRRHWAGNDSSSDQD